MTRNTVTLVTPLSSCFSCSGGGLPQRFHLFSQQTIRFQLGMLWDASILASRLNSDSTERSLTPLIAAGQLSFCCARLSVVAHRLANSVVHNEGMNIKQKLTIVSMIVALALSLALSPRRAIAQQNSNTASGHMKNSGREVRRAGRSMGRNVKHGRLVRGGKHFGQHMGRAGKHFGRGTKKAVKHAIS